MDNPELITRAIGARISDGLQQPWGERADDIGHRPLRGKSPPDDPALITVTMPLDQAMASPLVQEKGSVPATGGVDNFRITRPVSSDDEFIDGRDTFTVVVDDIRTGLSFQILDSDTPNLPPSLLDRVTSRRS